MFYLRSESHLTTAIAKNPLSEGWHHVAAVLDSDRSMRVYVDGIPTADATAPGLLKTRPKQALEVGIDNGGEVGDYPAGFGFSGLIDELALYFRALSPEEIRQRATVADARAAKDPVLACSFDKGDARDVSPTPADGVVSGLQAGKGKNSGALWFRTAKATPSKRGGKPDAKNNNGTFVQFDWNRYVPVMTQAMAMAGSHVLLAGPPDLVNEEYAFERLAQKDPAIHRDLAEQDAALRGDRGGVLQMVDTTSGEVSGEFTLERPPVWDGMAIANGRIFVSTTDGKVQCYGREKK